MVVVVVTHFSHVASPGTLHRTALSLAASDAVILT